MGGNNTMGGNGPRPNGNQFNGGGGFRGNNNSQNNNDNTKRFNNNRGPGGPQGAPPGNRRNDIGKYLLFCSNCQEAVEFLS